MMLQAASLLWCAVKQRSHKHLLDKAGYLISQLEYFLSAALYAVLGYWLAKALAYFPRPPCDCCFVLAGICCAEWVCDKGGGGTKWIYGQ